MAPIKNIDINIELDVLTGGCVAEVVNEILKFLLYQRNQIPLVYKTYKHFVSLWADQTTVRGDSLCSANGFFNFELELQRQKAKHTKELISDMLELVMKAFSKNRIECLRFLLGSTPFTAKEAYTIHINPDAIARNHCNDQHRFPPERLNRIILDLVSNEELYTTFNTDMGMTNLYLDFQILNDPCSFTKSHTIYKYAYELPPSCKIINMYLLHSCPPSLSSSSLNCCKDLEIFKDDMDIDMGANESNELRETREKVDQPEKRLIDSTSWWESKIIIRGFREKHIKGANIWTD